MAGITHPREQVNVLKKLEKELTCAICLEPFTHPKMLQCKHVFCQDCLALLQTTNRKGTKIEINCPKCHSPTHLPTLEGGDGIGGVGSLQDDNRIEQLQEIQEDLVTVYLNKSKEEEEEEEGGDQGPARWEACPSHDGKKLDLYCEECSEYICILCAFHRHADHSYDRMSDLIANCEREIQSVLNPLEERRALIREEITTLDVRMDEITQQEAKTREAIERRTSELHAAIEKRHDTLISELECIVSDMLDTASKKRHSLTSAERETEEGVKRAREHVEGMGEEERVKENKLLLQQIRKSISIIPEVTVERDEATITFLPCSSGTSSLPSPSSSFTTTLTQSSSSTTSLPSYSTTISSSLSLPSINSFSITSSSSSSPLPSSIVDPLLESCATHGKVYSYNVSPQNCHLLPSPIWDTTVTKETVTIAMEVCDTRGRPTDEEIISMQCELTSTITSTTMQCEIKRREPHQYIIKCKTLSKGKHHLSVKVEGQHIRGSPFNITALSSTLMLGEPVKVIDGIKNPRSIAIDKEGKLIVSETKNHRLSIYTRTGERVTSHGCLGNQPGQLNEPRGLSVTRDENIVVVDGNNHRLQSFDREGHFLKAGHFPAGQYNYLTGVAISPVDQRIYVVDSSNHRIHIFDQQMKLIKTFGKQGNGKSQFQFPLDVACDKDGRVYVADSDNHRIQVLTAEGTFVRKFGKAGPSKGELRNPAGVSIGERNGLVYVCESGNSRVSVFTRDGKCVTTFGKEGSGLGEFSSPRAITIDSDDLCYVCDTGNNRVQIF